MATCPNKASNEWKTLANEVGELEAYRDYLETKGEIRTSEEVKRKLEKRKLEDSINYSFKSLDILLSDKAKQIFEKGNKNGWDINKILTELAIPKEQKQLLIDLNIKDREQLTIELASKYNYNVEINTAKDNNLSYLFSTSENKHIVLDKLAQPLVYFDSKKEADDYINNYDQSKPIQHYSKLTVPGGTNYTENEISTPAITPNIKGHAIFSTEHGMGWFRSDDKVIPGEDYDELEWETESTNEVGTPFTTIKKTVQRVGEYSITKTRRILEVQSDLFQKGRNADNLTKNIGSKEQIITLNYDKQIGDWKYYVTYNFNEGKNKWKRKNLVTNVDEYIGQNQYEKDTGFK